MACKTNCIVYLESVRRKILPMYYSTMHGNKHFHDQSNTDLLYLMRQKKHQQEFQFNLDKEK